MQKNDRNLQTRWNYIRIYNAGMRRHFLYQKRMFCRKCSVLQIFHRVLQTNAEFCRKMQTIFFLQMFYDVDWMLNLFLYSRKKSTGSTGNTGTWNIPVLEIHNFLKYFKYSVLEIPNKYPCTWSTAQLWLNYSP